MSQAEAHCTVAPVTIRAHDHELACITLNSDGSRLASASKHGEFIFLCSISAFSYTYNMVICSDDNASYDMRIA